MIQRIQFRYIFIDKASEIGYPINCIILYDTHERWGDGEMMININFRDSRPIYEQVKTTLRKLIVSGAMSPDEKLPSVRELASQLVINPNTIQRAYRELEQEGYIISIPGKGSYAKRYLMVDAFGGIVFARRHRIGHAAFRAGVPFGAAKTAGSKRTVGRERYAELLADRY